MEVSRLAGSEQAENQDLTAPSMGQNDNADRSEQAVNQTQSQKQERNPLRFATGLVLLAVACSLLFQSISTYVDGLAALQYKAVTGRVNAVNTVFNAFDQTKSCTVAFSLDGKSYKTEVAIPPDRIVKTNEQVQLYYDSSNPNKAALVQEVDYDNTIVKGAFGLFALCFAVLLLFKGL